MLVDRSKAVRAPLCTPMPRYLTGRLGSRVSWTKVPARPRDFVAPTAESACQASLTVAGLTSILSANSRTVGSRSPVTKRPPRIKRCTAAAIPLGDESVIASRTMFPTSWESLPIASLSAVKMPLLALAYRNIQHKSNSTFVIPTTNRTVTLPNKHFGPT